MVPCKGKEPLYSGADRKRVSVQAKLDACGQGVEGQGGFGVNVVCVESDANVCVDGNDFFGVPLAPVLDEANIGRGPES